MLISWSIFHLNKSWTIYRTEEDAEAALELGEVERYYVIAEDYIESGKITGFSLEAQLIVGSDSPISQLIRRNLLLQLDDPYLGERVREPTVITYDGPPIPTFSFIPPDLDTSRLTVAITIGAFFTFLINISGALLLRAVQRESEARALEIVVNEHHAKPIYWWQAAGAQRLGVDTGWSDAFSGLVGLRPKS